MKYEVDVNVVLSGHATVDADSFEEAERKAKELTMAGSIHLGNLSSVSCVPYRNLTEGKGE